MNGQPTDDRGNNADRRIGEWADLSAMSRPPAARTGGAAGEGRGRGSRATPAAALCARAGDGAGRGGGRRRRGLRRIAPAVGRRAVGLRECGGQRVRAARPIGLTVAAGHLAGDDVLDIGRIDARSGWAYVLSPESSKLGVPILLMTDDVGATWRDATPPQQADFQPIIEFVDADHGWVLDADGPLWRTTDGGRSWQETALPTGRTGSSAAMSFVSASTGYLLLSANSDKDPEPWVLYRTEDGGASLQRVGAVTLPDEPALSGPLPMVAFSDPSSGVVAGWKVVLQTDDGGAHWSTVSLPATKGSAAPRLRGVSLLRAFGPQLVLLALIGGPTTP